MIERNLVSGLLSRLEVMHKKLPMPLYALVQWYLPDLEFRYVPYRVMGRRFLANRHRHYTALTTKQLRERRRSDTVFLLGCGQSISSIEDRVWEKIAAHDTLGWNYWIYHPFTPTYYALEYGGGNSSVDKEHVKLIKQRSDDYADTTILINSRARRRGMHPRLQPEYFPERARVGYFLFPKVVTCSETRPFCAADFRESMFYRGSLNLYLYFARLAGYRRIVLVGCEMNSAVPFYDDLPQAQWMKQIPGYILPREEREKQAYDGAYVSKNKHSLLTTIKAINEFVFKPEGIELCVFSEKSLLYPDVPLLQF